MNNIYIRPKNLNKIQNFYFFFKKLTKKKNILISNIYLIKSNSILKLFIYFFSTTILDLYFKKNLFLKKQFHFFKTNIIILKIFNLNLLISFKKLKILSYKLYKFKHNIFNQNIKIFNILLNLTILLTINKLNIELYLVTLLRIFKFLKKNQHSKFFLFLKVLFNIIINKNNQINMFTKIKGLKVIISGRLKGKPRSSSTKIISGRIGATSITSKTKNVSRDTYNRYGTFGFKLWINY